MLYILVARAKTQYIKEKVCEWLYPQKYSELQPKILHAFTLPQSKFWGNMEDGHIGTLTKKLVENFSGFYEITQTCLPKQIISV